MLSRWVGERAHRITSSPNDTPVVGDVDHLVPVGRQVLAHVVRPDRQLAVAPVDHHGQLDHLGPPVVAEGVERGPDGPPGEEHVVDQHHGGPGEVGGDVGGRFGQHGAQPDVVPVEGHVQGADGHVGALHLGQGLGQPMGDADAAGLQADQHDVVEAPVALGDLVGHPGDGAVARRRRT